MSDDAQQVEGGAQPADVLDLDRGERRRLLAGMVVRVSCTAVGLFAVYAVLPMDDLADANPTILLVGGLVAFVAVIALQVRAILVSDHPKLQAVEAVGAAIPLIVVVFATTYVAMSVAEPAAFSEPLTKVGSIYYTVTVLSTTGFGDITAASDAARVVVTAQMLIDLVLIGVVVRLLAGAAQRGLARQGRSSSVGPG